MLLDDSIWALGMLAQNAIYGKMGTDAFAAMMIVGTVDKLSFILLRESAQRPRSSSAIRSAQAGRMMPMFTASVSFGSPHSSARSVAVLVCTLGVYIPYLYTNTTPATQALAADTTFVMGFALPLWRSTSQSSWVS